MLRTPYDDLGMLLAEPAISSQPLLVHLLDDPAADLQALATVPAGSRPWTAPP